MPSRDEWLAERRKGIGGSDAAAALGLSPWKTNVQLWEEKTGRREDEDISDKECVRYGVDSEPLIRAQFAIDFPGLTVTHEEFEIVQHPEYPQLQASLDGRLVDSDGRRGILEIKTSTLNSALDRAKWDGQVPQIYFIQVLHYMLVTGADFAIVKARLRSMWGDELRITEKHFRFEREAHEEDISYLLERELAFWEHVKNDTRPDLVLPQI